MSGRKGRPVVFAVVVDLSLKRQSRTRGVVVVDVLILPESGCSMRLLSTLGNQLAWVCVLCDLKDSWVVVKRGAKVMIVLGRKVDG